MGRTGKLFAHEWSGVAPDLLATAKGIGAGFPLGACLATGRAAQGMTAGSHASTFGGNPLAMAVGNAVLDVMLAEGFLERVQRIANYLRQQLAMIVDKHATVIAGVRGQGLLIGLQCRASNVAVMEAARRHGLLTVPAGDNVLRLLPPLILSEPEVGEAIGRLDAACMELSA
jgi:acetylornithine/N-succinyldiaminopimelate aminotransferase